VHSFSEKIEKCQITWKTLFKLSLILFYLFREDISSFSKMIEDSLRILSMNQIALPAMTLEGGNRIMQAGTWVVSTYPTGRMTGGFIRTK